MVKIDIKNVASQKFTHGAEFESQELAQAWLDKQLAKLPCPFGVAEHQIETTPAVYDEQGVEIVPAGVETVSSEFEIIGPTDISAQVLQAQTNVEAKATLANADWKRMRHISQKALGIPTSLSEEDYIAMEESCQVARDSIVE